MSDKNPWASKKTTKKTSRGGSLASLLGTDSNLPTGNLPSSKPSTKEDRSSSPTRPLNALLSDGGGTGSSRSGASRKASTRVRSKAAVTPTQLSKPESKPKPSTSEPVPGLRLGDIPLSSTLTKPPSGRSPALRQPFGGSRDAHAGSAHARRARRLQPSFPVGSWVVIEWPYDAAYSRTPGELGQFTGCIERYDERGWLYARSADNVRFESPCGPLQVRMMK